MLRICFYMPYSQRRGEAHGTGSPDEGHRVAECIVQCREDGGMHMITHTLETSNKKEAGRPHNTSSSKPEMLSELTDEKKKRGAR